MNAAVLMNSQTPAHRLQSVLQVNVTLLTCLAAAIFAQAEGAVLPAVTIPLAIVALFVTDRRQQFVLSIPWANALGMAAFAAALIEFFSGGIEARLLAFGHLLVYLTWVLLFQAKTQKQYWWICALAILQIATGSVLTQGLWFGASLLGFFVVALWTLSVFSLHRAVRKAEGEVMQSREREARPSPSVRFSSIKGRGPSGRHAEREHEPEFDDQRSWPSTAGLEVHHRCGRLCPVVAGRLRTILCLDAARLGWTVPVSARYSDGG